MSAVLEMDDVGQLIADNPHWVFAEQARRSLVEFARQAWPLLEGGRKFMENWHIDAICEHLEAVSRGDITRLIINIPPRHMKSLSVSVLWPAWDWIDHPERQFLFSSYSERLSVRDSTKCRRVIVSDWYQNAFGPNACGEEAYQLTQEQNQKVRFENDKSGVRIATSVGGYLTGEGGDIIVVDDPHNVQDAESDTIREGVLEWWDMAMSTRLNDPELGAVVVIMQRVHERDLAGHILANESGWDHLMLPARYEKKHIHPVNSSLDFEDPRTEEGELLWPQRFGEKSITRISGQLGEYGTAGQLQQRPSPESGVFFKRDWIRWYKLADRPKHLQFFGASDYATKEDEGDFTVHGVAGVDPNEDLYVIDWWRQQASSNTWIDILIDLIRKWKPIEWGEEAGQIRASLGGFIDKRQREEKAYCFRKPFPSVHDKPTRAQAIRGRFEQGKVYLPIDAEWTDDLVSEMMKFPKGMNDDQVDVLGMFGRMLQEMSPASVPNEDLPFRATAEMSFDEIVKANARRRLNGNADAYSNGYH